MSYKKGISSLIVCHHEDALIERALLSIKDCTNEIIVIHDGPCLDKTVAIANKYTDKVYVTGQRKGIGESWYIKGFNLCKYEWILRIDADEYLSKELQNNIRNLSQNSDCDGFSFVWPIWDGVKYISYNALRKNFLFRKSKIGFIDKFHYPIKVLGKICNSNLIVHHKPLYNNWTQENFDKKLKKWALLQAKDHIVPIEEREVLNLNIKDLKKEQKRKSILYKLPISVLIITYLLHLKRILTKPQLVFDRGYWISGAFSAKYSYEVAINVAKLANTNESSKILRK